MKTLQENTLEQFFADVGFIPPAGVDNPVGLFLSDVSTPNNGQNKEIPKEIITFHNEIISDFINHLASAIPQYSEPQISGLNKEYDKKDFKQTHSFSDSKIEEPSLASAEFPKHQPNPKQPADFIMDNKPYWITHR